MKAPLVSTMRSKKKMKVLLMGKQKSGKTSMRSIIFANQVAKSTFRLAATLNVEHDHENFLGALKLNLWDCAGQEKYFRNYLTSQKHFIFENVRVMIYVFDFFSKALDQVPGVQALGAQGHEPSADAKELGYDIDTFRQCVGILKELSPKAQLFVLIHKMDLIPEQLRAKEFETKRQLVEAHALGFPIKFFRTSIWDETLFKAWSVIVNSMIPNIKVVEQHITHFCDVCGADEVVLFEKNTFLVIAKATRKAYRDVQRFEKISNIVKQFKLACKKTRKRFEAMVVRNSSFSAFIEMFTSNTAILVIVSDKTIQPAATQLNIRIAKNHFERLLQSVTHTKQQRS